MPLGGGCFGSAVHVSGRRGHRRSHRRLAVGRGQPLRPSARDLAAAAGGHPPATWTIPATASPPTTGEGVYVGYRWYDGRRMPVRWPFGHGLSYTGFVYRDAALDADTPYRRGQRHPAGEGAPTAAPWPGLRWCSSMSATPPAHRWPAAGWCSRCGASRRYGWNRARNAKSAFHHRPRDLSHYSAELHDWYAAPGRYELRLGHSSRDIRMTVPLEFSTRRHLPLTVDENTPLGILLADPPHGGAGAPHAGIQRPGHGQRRRGRSDAPRCHGPRCWTPLPLRGLVNFGGPEAAAALPALLDTLRRAVQS